MSSNMDSSMKEIKNTGGYNNGTTTGTTYN